MKTKTFDEYIKLAKEIHGDKYKYNQISKINNYLCLEIECINHGKFQKRISNHIIKKQGCPLCSKPQKLTNEMFIKKAIEIHQNKYDYSKVEYINGKNKICIICKIHGEFEQLPTNHLKGQNCPDCAGKKVTQNIFIKRSIDYHKNKYDYSLVKFKNMTEPVKIICKVHGIFEQLPRYHLDSNGCYKCSGITRNTEDFINNSKLIHNDLYNYSKVNYENTRKQVIIICKIHGEFKQTPNDHLNSYGCAKCSKSNYSKKCIEWLENIMKKDNIFIQHAKNIGEKKIKINNKLFKLDGYCEKTNTVYEFYGDIWHGNPLKYNENDINPINKKNMVNYIMIQLKEKNYLKLIIIMLLLFGKMNIIKNTKQFPLFFIILFNSFLSSTFLYFSYL
jgi:hypothetical protein